MIINLIEFAKEEKIKLQIVGTEDQLIIVPDKMFLQSTEEGKCPYKYILIFTIINRSKNPYTLSLGNKSKELKSIDNLEDELLKDKIKEINKNLLPVSNLKDINDFKEKYILPNSVTRVKYSIPFNSMETYYFITDIPSMGIDVAGYELERLK